MALLLDPGEPDPLPMAPPDTPRETLLLLGEAPLLALVPTGVETLLLLGEASLLLLPFVGVLTLLREPPPANPGLGAVGDGVGVGVFTLLVLGDLVG